MTVEVTQADREAAARLSSIPIHATNVRRGNLDDLDLVQTFAHHREQAERETVEKICAWLKAEDATRPDDNWFGHVAYRLERGEWKR